MRLRYIKLAGFKSFADVVKVEVSGNLTGVVGPNGCGKSNIIDAVRWVLGERSINKLRGMEMTDVIFNGSQTRRPSGRSSVELFFDNDTQDFGGVWNQFTELSIKRELIRSSGQSNYSINGKSVRLKDIQKIFMGTGLGSSAPYAIIGQGDISEIVESRPEDMRNRLEEAAGVSFYKQRRQETQNSLESSQNNLERIQDILRELGESVAVLTKQAEVAQKFTSFSDEMQEKQLISWFLQYRKAYDELEKLETELGELTEILSAREAEVEAKKSEYAALRSVRMKAADALFELQGKQRAIEGQINSTQREIDMIATRKSFLSSDIHERTLEKERTEGEITQAETEKVNFDDVIFSLTQKEAALKEQLRQQKEEVTASEKVCQKIRNEVDGSYRVLRAKEKRLAECNFSIQADRKTLQEAQARKDRLEKEKTSIPEPKKAELAALETEVQSIESKLSDLRVSVTEQERRLSESREKEKVTENQYREINARRQAVSSNLSSLIQQQNRYQAAEGVEAWLRKKNLSSQGSLSDEILVKNGWEAAIESVLAERLSAHQVAKEALPIIAGEQTTKSAVFYAGGKQSILEKSSEEWTPLTDLLKDKEGRSSHLIRWLENFYVAESLKYAFDHIDKLPSGSSFVLKDGTIIGHDTVKKFGTSSSDSSVLARKAHIKALQTECDQLAEKVKAQQLTLSEQGRIKSAEEEKLKNLVREQRRLEENRNDFRIRFSALQEKSKALVMQRERVQRELGEQAEKIQRLSERLKNSLSDQETLDQEQKHLREDLEKVKAESTAKAGELEKGREALRNLQFEIDKLLLQLTHTREEEKRAEQRISRFKENLERLTSSIQKNTEELARLDDTSLQQQLEKENNQKEVVLAQISLAIANLEKSQEAENEAERIRQEKEQSLGPIRKRINTIQQKLGATRANKERFGELLDENRADYGFLWEVIHQKAFNLAVLKQEISSLDESIKALGPVNLAAMQELTEKKDRFDALTRQSEDVIQAIKTLKDAIKTIDFETKQRLETTYDAVNKNFAEVFKKLFGGGSAVLEKNEEDILQAGFIVKAQPPGKRNSTISSLSGGEKALTAIAFVLSIFKLNPAPFCLLDEVDAPLDEANQDRFASLIKEMSETTQFLLITHKRVTMEHLVRIIGVTMKEAGVSQVVGVDMAKALSYANRSGATR